LRFKRDYMLTVQISDEQAVVVRPPFRVVFSADKTSDPSLNKATIKIYNLAADNRLAVVKDENEKKKLGVELMVGYDGTVERIFKGSIHVGQNAREGADIVTTLECQDGGFDFRYSFTSKSTRSDAVDAILEDMPNTTRGKITAQRPATTRPRVLVGNSYKLIGRTLRDQKWFIDDEALNVVADDEVISDFVPVVEARTGLINTPTREEKKVTFQTLLNPALRVAGLCEIRSVTAPHLNGIYKIESIGYDGDYDGTAWTQTVTGTLTAEYKVIT